MFVKCFCVSENLKSDKIFDDCYKNSNILSGGRGNRDILKKLRVFKKKSLSQKKQSLSKGFDLILFDYFKFTENKEKFNNIGNYFENHLHELAETGNIVLIPCNNHIFQRLDEKVQLYQEIFSSINSSSQR